MSVCQAHCVARIEPEPPLSYDDLLEPLASAGKVPERWRIGAEQEKFGVDALSGAPLGYDGERSVRSVFAELCRRYDWHEESEGADGPVIALRRGEGAITLEPGGQLELSGAPFPTLHQVAEDLARHASELDELGGELGITWLASGFHPLAAQAELPWVPKARYRIMREYFPQRGSRGLDMMRRTATVQVNLDYANEADAMRKLRVALRLSPIVSAMFANAPFYEGRVAARYRSQRVEVWLDVDRDRAGLLPALTEPGRHFADYVEWALDVPMFLFKRDGQVIANTGQTFRSFWQHGYFGHRATRRDWRQHLTTLFPEVRLKGFLEMRGADSVPRALGPAAPALWVGLLYDARALDGAEALAERFDIEQIEAARPSVAELGLGARLGGRPLRALAGELVDLALGGLERRAKLDARGTDERCHLLGLARLVEHGRCPADEVLDGLDPGLQGEALRAEILRRTRF